MPKHQTLHVFLGSVLLVAIFLISCTKEGSSDDQPDPIDTITPPPPPPVTGCKQCEYYPVCDGSWFVMLDSAYPEQPVSYTDTMRSLADTTINGLVYKKTRVVSPKYPSVEYLNCANGVYRLGGKYGFGLKPITILKVNEPVGTSWVETAGTGATVAFTILGKGLPIEVNGRTYTDVIKVLFEIGGFGSTYRANYYFAKGVGIVRFEYSQFNFDPNWYHRGQVQAFHIP